MSAMMCVALMASTAVMAQDTTTPKKDGCCKAKTECKKDGEKKSCCKDKKETDKKCTKGEKKSCCTDKKAEKK